MAAFLRNLLEKREPRRYLLVGGSCAIVSNLILIAGDAAGLHYVLSIGLVFLIVLPFSYLAHARWTFESAISSTGFARFVLGSLSSFLAGGLLVALLRGGLMLPMFMAAPLTTAVMTVYNFLMSKWAVTRGANLRFGAS